MIGRDGTPMIQEELRETVRVFTLDEWNAELARRAAKGEEAGVEVELQDNEAQDHEETNGLIQDDDEDKTDSEVSGEALIEEDTDPAATEGTV